MVSCRLLGLLIHSDLSWQSLIDQNVAKRKMRLFK